MVRWSFRGWFVATIARVRGKGSPRSSGDQARDARLWERAARFYLDSLSADPEDIEIWVQLGHVLKEAGKLSEAEKAYRRADEIRSARPRSILWWRIRSINAIFPTGTEPHVKADSVRSDNQFG